MTSEHPEALRSRARRVALREKFPRPRYVEAPETATDRVDLRVETGIVLIGSDCHYWPGEPSAAHRAFVAFAREMQPAAIILNGDVMDGARISRWPAGDWVKYGERPSVVEELAVAQERLREIHSAVSMNTPLFWTLGNHDARFETYLIGAAPEVAGVHGTRLKDHFPDWTPAMSVFINGHTEHAVMVKHRFKSGLHAPHNNTKDAGVSIITGHLHSLKVMPWSDLRGTRWGVDGGTLAAPHGPQFIYAEDNPVNWRSGFVVLSFVEGRLLWPEVAWVMDQNGLVCFRGRRFEV